MKILLVDDEPAMLIAMRRLLTKIEGVEVVGSLQQVSEVLAFVQEEDVDLAFLDIQIAEDNGLELAHRLRSLRPDLAIVFTTSHAEYAIDAYDVYPLDYILKPVSRTRLAQTIDRAAGMRRTPAGAGNDIGTLQIRTLGCLDASSTQAGTVKWVSKKSMELFAYLLLHRGQKVSKHRLLEDIFPDMPYKNAETYLYTAVYQLRKALTPHGFKTMVVSSQEQYHVVLEQTRVDFIQLEQALAAWTEINSGNVAAAIELEARYTGGLFEDQSFVWAAMEQERLAILYTSFAKRLGSWLLAHKHFREAAQVARRLVARNEFEEESNLLLLTVLGAMGDRPSLHHYYEHYKQLLLQELGLQPSQMMIRAYERYL